MLRGASAQDRLALLGEPHDDLSSVRGMAPPLDETALLQAIDQAHGAVMPNLEALGECAHGRGHARWETGNHQQELMLLGLEIRGASNLLAEMKEPTNLVAKLGQRSVVFDRHIVVRYCVPHKYIALRYKFIESC
jgi:hypothetical protein